MADSGERRMNLAALQRMDPYIINIMAMASQVALYKFNATTNEWEKTEVEGTLFVYGRCAKPYYGLIIMNRLNRNNLVEPLTTEMEFQKQEPFLLYKNSKAIIYGIWFYDKDDCSQIDDVMNRLIDRLMDVINKKEKNECNQAHRLPNAGIPQTETKTVDIVSMLTKAQNEYNHSKGVSGGIVRTAELKHMTDNAIDLTDIVRPRAVRATNSSGPPPDLTSGTGRRSAENDGTSLSVAALFASASGMQQDTRNNNNSLDMTGKQIFSPSKTALIDNQKFSGKLEWTRGGEGDVSSPGEQSLHAVLQRLISNSEQSADKDTHGDPCRRSTPSDEIFRQVQTGDSENYRTILGSRKNSLSNIFTPAMLERPFASSPVLSDLGCTVLSSTPPKTLPIACGMLNASLMSPMMFTTPKPPSTSDQSITSSTQITPLTKEQLGQAMIYVIQNDQDVLTKLHEAYVKSLTAFVSGHIKS